MKRFLSLFGCICFFVAFILWLILGITDQSSLKCLASLFFLVGGIVELKAWFIAKK